MKFRLALTIYGLLAMIYFVSPGPVGAQTGGEGSIQFLESRAISLILPVGQEQVDTQVRVVHSSPEPLEITLELVQFSNEENAALPADAAVHLPQTAGQVGPGQAHTFNIGFKRVPGLAGTYTGELVAIASNGAIARLPLTLDIPGEPQALQAEPDSGVDPTYLTEFNRRTMNLVPSILASRGASNVQPVRIETNKDYTSTPRLVGELASEEGPIGLVWQDGTQLVVRDLQRAGKYSGSVDLQPDVDGGELKLQVSVRDHPIYAGVALFIGLAIAHFLEKHYKENRPRRRLKKRLDDVKEKAISEQDRLIGELPADWPADWAKFRIYVARPRKEGSKDQPVEPPSLLAAEALRIQKKFNDAEGEEERKKWAADGEEVTKFEGHLDSLRGMHEPARGIYKQYKLLREEIANFDTLPLAKQTREALVRDSLIESKEDLDKVMPQLQEVGEFMEEFFQLYIWLPSVEEAAQGKDRELVQDWEKKLKTPVIDSIAVVQAIREEAEELVTRLSDRPQKRSRSGDLLVRELFTLRPQLDLLSRVLRRSDITSETPEETVKRLSDLERYYSLVSGLVVLGTGFYTLYLANPTFGSTYDYLNALLWGTAVGGGFQLARSLIPTLKT